MIFFKLILIFLLSSFSVNADQKDFRLDNLFSILSKTESDEEINRITSSIWDIWLETNDPSINRDFYYGLKFMRSGDLKMSVKFFTKVINKNSNFAEAWNKRATVYYLLGDFDLSMIDINETLKLEPRHFGAMDGLSMIFIHLQEFEKAIQIYDQMLKIFPNNSLVVKKRKRLLKLITKST